MEKPFTLGDSSQTYSAPSSGPNSKVIWTLALLMVTVVVIAAIFLLGSGSSGVSIAGSEPAASQFLQGASLDALPLPKRPARPDCPPWLVALIASFVLLQIFPLVLAYQRAGAGLLSQKEIRRISFLCEVPMYLGLLGSLLGVCLTQYISGNLAAPLAYLTTISGIILYIFGRFSIGLALPEPYDNNNV